MSARRTPRRSFLRPLPADGSAPSADPPPRRDCTPVPVTAPSLGAASGSTLNSAYIGVVSDLGERLRARGKRLTSQRERVLGALGSLGHATPDEIVDAVAGDGGDAVPASTVYRALEALQELGLVGHTHVDHRAPSYHLAEHATHLHVVCRGCGWVGE